VDLIDVYRDDQGVFVGTARMKKQKNNIAREKQNGDGQFKRKKN
jgi:hypothetical protein